MPEPRNTLPARYYDGRSAGAHLVILAHEIGHVQHDHATVGVLRSMGITAILQRPTAGSGAETLAEFGGTLAFLSYSRAACRGGRRPETGTRCEPPDLD